jgi:uncharacterized protein DUF4168
MEKSMLFLTRTFSAAALAVAWMAFVPAASAQTEQSPSASPSEQQPPGSPSEEAPNIPDQKLDAIAAALQRVVTVRENYERKLQEAQPSDVERIANEAKGELVKAVTDQGLSVEEYNKILVVAQNDPQVRQKILQRVRPPAQ